MTYPYEVHSLGKDKDKEYKRVVSAMIEGSTQDRGDTQEARRPAGACVVESLKASPKEVCADHYALISQFHPSTLWVGSNHIPCFANCIPGRFPKADGARGDSKAGGGCWLPRTTVTKYHKLGGLNSTN